MEEQLKQEFARLMQAEQSILAQRDRIINQAQELTNELLRVQGEGRLVRKLLAQLNKATEAEQVESEEE